MRARRLRLEVAAAVILMTACAGNDPPSTDDAPVTPSPAPFTEADAAPTEAVSPAVELAAPDQDALVIRYADSFENDSTGWLDSRTTTKSVSTDLGYRGGSYEMSLDVPKAVKGGASYRSFSPDDAHLWTTIEVSADARKAGDPGPIGLTCFEQDDEAGGYEFLLDGDGTMAIIKRVGRRQLPLAEDTLPDVVNPRGGNKLRIQCFSDGGEVHLRLFVNDQEMMRIADAEEPLYRHGRAGFVVAAGPGASVAAAFDDFVVRGDR